MMYFWIILISTFFIAAALFVLRILDIPAGRKKEDPLDILKRRFANGEIDEIEFEERKAVLEEDEYLKYNP